MSSTAPATRLPQFARQISGIAQHSILGRARLTVVPRRRTRAPRIPFVTFVSIILLGGVVGLLLFNTSMQGASFRATALQQQATDLGARQEALEMDLQKLREPQRVARAAQQLGMVIPATPAGVLHLGSGHVSGHPSPATGADTIPLTPPGPSRPSSLDPTPVRVQAKATTTTTTRTSKANTTVKANKTRKSGTTGAPRGNR